MYLEPHHPDRTKTTQSVPETHRLGGTGFIQKLSTGLGTRPKLCQRIEGEPTRQEYRTYGVDNFKCLKDVKPGYPYCPGCCAKCYVTKPAAEVEST